LVDETEPSVASHTLVLLRAMDRKLDHAIETLSRHDVRLGRLERDLGELRRDLGEVKSDLVLIENRILTQTNEILRVVQRLNEQDALAGQPH
jgi:regulator of replication initiation timing